MRWYLVVAGFVLASLLAASLVVLTRTAARPRDRVRVALPAVAAVPSVATDSLVSPVGGGTVSRVAFEDAIEPDGAALSVDAEAPAAEASLPRIVEASDGRMRVWMWESNYASLVDTLREQYRIEVPERAWQDERVRELWRLVRLRDGFASWVQHYFDREFDRWSADEISIPLIDESKEALAAFVLEFGDSDELYSALDAYDAAVRVAIWEGGEDTPGRSRPSIDRLVEEVYRLGSPAVEALLETLKEYKP